jgi:RNA polymerase sigma-70 factor (ECF subfamily)
MSRFSNVDVHPQVVRRLAQGERDAQEAVYRAYASAVYTMARRILRDQGLAEEATQDTFLDVIRGAANLDCAQALGPWIRTIAVNQCLMRLRSPWHQRREELADDERAAAPDADRALDIDKALGRLPAQARMVVWMYCVEGYTHEEIGRAFRRTASFSKSCLARAWRELAAHRECDPRRPSEVAADGRPIRKGMH